MRKLDELMAMETEVRNMWAEKGIFTEDAPIEKDGREKFFVTFPYPYMNGRLHLGHLFSLTKSDFAAGYQKMKGKRVLFPFGFHGSGMPIKACADRLRAELAEGAVEKVAEKIEETSVEDSAVEAGERKFKANKTKAKSKTGTASTQYAIMQAMGIPEEDISLFQDPYYWIDYFPPKAIDDLKQFGAKVDWRRSFITTDKNPYYDGFIRWQFHRLKEMERVKFGTRATIYSPKDGQACADHDRSSGEGLVPQEYVVIKMRVKDVSALKPDAAAALADYSDRVYLGAATFRAETMFGQTNCWAHPTGQYSPYLMKNGDVLVSGPRAALNMYHQNLIEDDGTGAPKVVGPTIQGDSLFGVELEAALTPYKSVFVLPLQTIKLDKGTGIVTSVPSDAPDDYAAYHDMQVLSGLIEADPLPKALERLVKFNVKAEWCTNPSLPIIRIENFIEKDGETISTVESAKDMCELLGIDTQFDKEKLVEAKGKTYNDGFYKGIMWLNDVKAAGANTVLDIAGTPTEIDGMPVPEAKLVVRDHLIQINRAFVYSEPEGVVMSRSGDECVVKFTDQWYLDYGEEGWKAAIKRALESMDLYSDEIRFQFNKAADWLSQWACSRSFGLGTRIPWDDQFLVESLSDSTIYMAYYTVAHILHSSIDGAEQGEGSIAPEAMTNAVWDAVLLGEFDGLDGTVPRETVEAMHREFTYWYPVDLRVSGKELIQNHLTMYLYNHTAVWPDKALDPVRGKDEWAPQCWPKGIRTNGHIMVDNEKMSKSKGNFLVGIDAMGEYGSDGLRFALADSGDGMEDANFNRPDASKAVLRLMKQYDWMKGMMANDGLRTDELRFADRVFLGNMHVILTKTDEAYDRMLFKRAVKLGFFDLQNARDKYRLAVGSDDNMHRTCVETFVRLQAALLAPVTSHWSEYIHTHIIHGEGSIFNAPWPVVPGETADLELAVVQSDYLENFITVTKRKYRKRGATSYDVVVADAWHPWQLFALKVMHSCYDAAANKFHTDPKTVLKTTEGFADHAKQMKFIMAFVAMKQKQIGVQGAHAIAVELPFVEIDVLKDNADYLKDQLSVKAINVFSMDGYGQKIKSDPSPGEPLVIPKKD